MLTRAAAVRICEVVAADARCRERIGTRQGGYTVTSCTGWAGGVRNGPMIVYGMDPGTPGFDTYSCVGVTKATTEAITAAAVAGSAKTGKPAFLPEVKHATGVYRVLDGTHHQASWVVLVDGSDYVFDWHASLDLHNPFLYRLLPDWRKDENGVQLSGFTGFDVTPVDARPLAWEQPAAAG